MISGFWLRGFHVQWYNLSVVPLLVKPALKRCVVLYISQDYIYLDISSTNKKYKHSIHTQTRTNYIHLVCFGAVGDEHSLSRMLALVSLLLSG